MTTRLEYLVLSLVLILQFYFFLKSKNAIKELMLFFPVKAFGDDSLELTDVNGQNNVMLLKAYGNNSKSFISVIDSVNKYLLKNKGVTDFNIIKSIIERKLDSLEDDGTSNISLPLYIGLMGTFIGITIGLANIAFNPTIANFTSTNPIPINDLLGGVVLAMVGSFAGLLFTVINTSHYLKRAKFITQSKKNLFYDFLQVELLPHLQNGLFDALDRLALNINDFNKRFQNNIQLFDSKFAVNISSLNDSVSSLSSNMSAIIDNTNSQQMFLQEIKAIGYNKMAEANIRVFSMLNDSLPTLTTFIDKQKELNESVNSASLVVNTIQNIMNRVRTFEESINNLGTSLTTKEFMGNETLKRIDTNLKYLDQQYELLKQHSVDSSGKIEDFFTGETKRIGNLTDTIKREVQEALSINIADNPFQKLLLLESVDTQLKGMAVQLGIREEDSKGNTLTMNALMSEISNKLDSIAINTASKTSKDNKAQLSLSKKRTAETKGIWNRFKIVFKKR